MPNHETHDRIAFVAAPMVAAGAGVVALSLSVPPDIAAGTATIITASHLACSWWLSPDLDTDSAIAGRWGPAGIIWWPYQKLVPHRSWISHSGVSALLRLAYLGGIIWAGSLLAQGVDLAAIAMRYQNELALFAIGAVIADYLHVIADKLSTGSKTILRRLMPRWVYRAIVK